MTHPLLPQGMDDVTSDKHLADSPPDPDKFYANPERYDELGHERPTLRDAHLRVGPSTVVSQSGVAASMLEVTERLWRFCPWRGRDAEPLEHAWRRLFGAVLDPPMLIHYVLWRGRELVVRSHRAGRLSVLDQTTGRHEIRKVAAHWEAVVNACFERASLGGSQAHAHIKMAAATERFLQGAAL